MFHWFLVLAFFFFFNFYSAGAPILSVSPLSRVPCPVWGSVSLHVPPALCLARPCLAGHGRPEPHRYCRVASGSWVFFTRPPWRLLRATAGWGQPMARRLLRFRDLPRASACEFKDMWPSPCVFGGGSSPIAARIWEQRVRLCGLGSVRLKQYLLGLLPFKRASALGIRASGAARELRHLWAVFIRAPAF